MELSAVPCVILQNTQNTTPPLINLIMVNKSTYAFHILGRYCGDFTPRLCNGKPVRFNKREFELWALGTFRTSKIIAVITFTRGDHLVLMGYPRKIASFMNGYELHNEFKVLELLPATSYVFHCKIRVSTYEHNRMKVIRIGCEPLILDDVPTIEL